MTDCSIVVSTINVVWHEICNSVNGEAALDAVKVTPTKAVCK